MQLQSDILRTKVIRPTVTETTALGAAYLAGLATGIWENKAAIKKHWKAARTISPKMKAADRASLLIGWEKAIRNLQ